LAAFVAIREFLLGLLARNYISDAAERYLQLLLDQIPWLHYAPPSDERPVRHNLTQSFLHQLQQAVGDEDVEELIVLSPFYDPEVIALQHMLSTLRPAQMTILMQRETTSVDPERLQSTLDRFGGKSHVQPVQRADGDPYIHAKLYIVKQAQRAICLHGSPNLSQVAMLLTPPQGNIELANLLIGARDSFDHLLAGLAIEQPVEHVRSLNVRYQAPGKTALDQRAPWWLTGATWDGERLRIHYRGVLPNLDGIVLHLGHQQAAVQGYKVYQNTLELVLPAGTHALFDQPVAVRVQLSGGDTTNPVFACNFVALDTALEVTGDDVTLSRIGGLDVDDQELETLLGLLDGALLIDRRSIWQIAGKKPSDSAPDGDDAPILRYADIDYTMLRQHPRIQQYLRRGGHTSATRSRLQIILSAISSHFLDILDRATRSASPSGSSALPTTDRPEEELEDEEEIVARMASPTQHTQRILKGFIQRYLAGIGNREFRELAGAEVLAQNYIIFSHVLWRIWVKGWVDPGFLTSAFLATWQSFWGDDEQPGCFASASDKARPRIVELLREHYTVSTLLAALYACATRVRTERQDRERLDLRAFWRSFLVRHAQHITQETIEETWYHIADILPYGTPTPVAIIDELTELAHFDTTAQFLRSIEQRYYYPRGSCSFERVQVQRLGATRSTMVDCLVIDAPNGLQTAEEAIAILQSWMQFKELPYYRLTSLDSDRSQRVAWYETALQSGLYWDRQTDQAIDLHTIFPKPELWEERLTELRHYASLLKVTIHMPQLTGSSATTVLK
jgi:hypothetical protein